MRLTRRYRFSASHRLDLPRLTPEENRSLYGKCNNPHGHGHNYSLDVSLRGPLDATGRVADIRDLDRLVRDTVLAALDHKNLNAQVAAFRSIVPTTENIAVYIKTLLEGSWKTAFPSPGPALDRIRIEETDNNFFELRSL